MLPNSRVKPRVFLDSDVVLAGITSATDFAASLILVRLAEINLIEGVCSEQVIMEVQQTLQAKMPQAVKSFNTLVKQVIKVKPDPSTEERSLYKTMAGRIHVPILAVALREQCTWLATFNEQQYKPGHPDILIARPDELVSRLRGQFAWQGS
jgi:predicted nucleic acid-binding protein